MGRFLAVLVRAAAIILHLPADGAEPSIGLHRQDDEIAADIVCDNQVVSCRIRGDATIERLDRAGVQS